jgi:2,3-dihydroxybiphenyl 1,2-dioxygenase
MDSKQSTSVHGLGYLGIVANDIGEWRRFGSDLLGLQPVDHDGELRFRLDERSWRIAVTQGDVPGLAYLGFDTGGPESFRLILEQLRNVGFVSSEDPAAADRRDVSRLAKVVDPGGNEIELFYGAKVAEEEFVSGTGARFVTGLCGLGHVVLAVPDLSAAFTFYVDGLGFRHTDQVTIDLGTVYFFHCNARHHTVALIEIPGLSLFHHLMLEVDDLRVLGRAYDRALDGGVPITASLGQHANDLALSFYVEGPSGFEVEYGFQSRLVEDQVWVAGSYSTDNLWGHRRPTPLGPPD